MLFPCELQFSHHHFLIVFFIIPTLALSALHLSPRFPRLKEVIKRSGVELSVEEVELGEREGYSCTYPPTHHLPLMVHGALSLLGLGMVLTTLVQETLTHHRPLLPACP